MGINDNWTITIFYILLFSKVYKGKCLRTGILVALKKFRIETEKEGVMSNFLCDF